MNGNFFFSLFPFGPQFFLLQSRLNQSRTPLPPFFFSCLPLFPVSPSTSVILCATQSLLFPFLMSLNTHGVWCIHPKELEGTWHGVSFPSIVDSALLPWLSCSDVPAVRNTTLEWPLETVVSIVWIFWWIHLCFVERGFPSVIFTSPFAIFILVLFMNFIHCYSKGKECCHCASQIRSSQVSSRGNSRNGSLGKGMASKRSHQAHSWWRKIWLLWVKKERADAHGRSKWARKRKGILQ